MESVNELPIYRIDDGENREQMLIIKTNADHPRNMVDLVIAGHTYTVAANMVICGVTNSLNSPQDAWDEGDPDYQPSNGKD